MQRLPRRRIPERDEEERDVVLPWQTAVRGQVDFGRDVAVAVGGVGDGEFFEVGLVVDVPTAAGKVRSVWGLIVRRWGYVQDHGAEAEFAFCSAEELGLGHELATENTIDIDT
jgi:hypothetical protein